MTSRLEKELEGAGWTRPVAIKESPTLNRKYLEQVAERERVARNAAEAVEEERLLRVAEMRTEMRAASPPVQKTETRKLVAGYGAAVIASLVLVVGVVLVMRSAQRADALEQERQSRATLVCTDGGVSARNSRNFWTWVSGGSDFKCSNWETQEARKDREMAAKEAAKVAFQERKRREAMEPFVPTR